MRAGYAQHDIAGPEAQSSSITYGAEGGFTVTPKDEGSAIFLPTLSLYARLLYCTSPHD